MAQIKEHYQAIVDMGSNGIRFSIFDVSPATARILPTIYQDRCTISLYDAQLSCGHKIPIPESVIDDVLTALLRFKDICQNLGVADSNIRLVATEATRNAINSLDFLRRIDEKLTWKPELLSKEEEGRVGAMGIASSVEDVEGLVMDLGGGSVQITWMIKSQTGEIELGPCISLPYGAAALMSHLKEADGSKDEEILLDNIHSELRYSLQQLKIPEELKQKADYQGGYKLYLSGGGFRAWGHRLMSLDAVHPYPVAIVNGYSVCGSRFLPNLEHESIASRSHRISKRRASQVPAVQVIVKALLRALRPANILQVRFCQGGVREGLVYSDLPSTVRCLNPLTVATCPYSPLSAEIMAGLLHAAIPGRTVKPQIRTSTIHLLFVHAPCSKDIRAAAALRSTTTGILASAHGLSHNDRAALALTLCERWGGEESIPQTDVDFFHNMQSVVGQKFSWWAKIIGQTAHLIGELYPAGVVGVRDTAVSFESALLEANGRRLDSTGNEAQASKIWIQCTVSNGIAAEAVDVWARKVKKLGKRKNWIGGADGWGLDVNVEVVNEHH